jgi:hypothetical protein
MNRLAVRVAAALAVALSAASAPAGPEDPMQGAAFERALRSQNAGLQAFLTGYFPDSLGYQVAGPLGALKREAPRVAWPNKEAPPLQSDFREYFERGWDRTEVYTLTRSIVARLEPGAYFYAVGLNGRIRFASETPREEVERVEVQSGREVLRANHPFLFPGEPVLMAGAFFVERRSGPRIVRVNAHSGHYFYSNVTETVREDIALHSDEYLLTVGHFLAALDREKIPCDGILISKM